MSLCTASMLSVSNGKCVYMYEIYIMLTRCLARIVLITERDSWQSTIRQSMEAVYSRQLIVWWSRMKSLREWPIVEVEGWQRPEENPRTTSSTHVGYRHPRHTMTRSVTLSYIVYKYTRPMKLILYFLHILFSLLLYIVPLTSLSKRCPLVYRSMV